MTKRTYGHAKSGKPIDDQLIEQLTEEAEAGYDVDEITPAEASAVGHRSAPHHQLSSPSGSTPSSRNDSRDEPKTRESRSPRSSEKPYDTTSKPADDLPLNAVI